MHPRYDFKQMALVSEATLDPNGSRKTGSVSVTRHILSRFPLPHFLHCLLALHPPDTHSTTAHCGRFRCVAQVNLSLCRRQSNSRQLSPSETSVGLSISKAGKLDVDFRNLLNAPVTLQYGCCKSTQNVPCTPLPSPDRAAGSSASYHMFQQ